ncbi:MAG: hypothetical protein U0229_23765 [Anaeromyxobacter sp.]
MRNPKMMKLHGEIGELVDGERHDLVEFLRKIDALDQGRGYCEFNCGSTFEYITKVWHLCEGTAWHRVNAMRYLRRFPQLAEEIASGRLNLSQLKIIGPLLTPENADDLFARAAGLSYRKTEELAVSIKPKAVPADGVRKLPAPKLASITAPVATIEGSTLAALPADAPPEPSARMGTEPPRSQGFELTAPVALPRRPDRGEVMPVAKDEFHFRAHLDDETKRLFDELAGLLANVVPDRAPAKLLAIMVRDSRRGAEAQRGC